MSSLQMDKNQCQDENNTNVAMLRDALCGKNNTNHIPEHQYQVCVFFIILNFFAIKWDQIHSNSNSSVAVIVILLYSNSTVTVTVQLLLCSQFYKQLKNTFTLIGDE